MAVGIAWLEYMAFQQFGDDKYLAAADLCLTQMNSRGLNPFYESLGFFGPVLAARLNAELGRSYLTGKHLNWIFQSTSDARPVPGFDEDRKSRPFRYVPNECFVAVRFRAAQAMIQVQNAEP